MGVLGLAVDGGKGCGLNRAGPALPGQPLWGQRFLLRSRTVGLQVAQHTHRAKLGVLAALCVPFTLAC
jgi:hypothetical protein